LPALVLLACSQNICAQEQCGYRVSIAVSGFERGEQPAEAELPPPGTPLVFNLVWPSEGAVIGARAVHVRGTLTGPANTGVVINERELAMTNVSAFT
jgi:hypothetical protein